MWGFIYGCQDNFNIYQANINYPFPDVVNSDGVVLARRNAGAAIYFGYCSALLGITGFETASNYVEEMRDPAVFVTTVNWMWLVLCIIYVYTFIKLIYFNIYFFFFY
jgi:amino acid transporter